jgi:hypothetical protein
MTAGDTGYQYSDKLELKIVGDTIRGPSMDQKYKSYHFS